MCMTKKDGRENASKSKRMGGGRSQRKMQAEEELLHRQALSMAIHQHQLSQRFEGSMSRRIGGSTSSRRRNLSNDIDPLSNAKQVVCPMSLHYLVLIEMTHFSGISFFLD